MALVPSNTFVISDVTPEFLQCGAMMQDRSCRCYKSLQFRKDPSTFALSKFPLHPPVYMSSINPDSLEHFNYTGMSDPFAFTQTPTPMRSHSPSPVDEDPIVVSVSTVFFPGAHASVSDVVLSSSDSVLFYVHSHVLLGASNNAFLPILSASLSHPKYRTEIIQVPETSAVLNIILHILYSSSCVQHAPSFDTLFTAITQLPQYAFSPKTLVAPPNPIHGHLLSFAPLHSIELYTLAAHFDLNSLAAATSSHLLSFPLATISDDMAERMGAVYLKRLLCLHVNRFDALKSILLRAPHPHPPTKECDFEGQKKLTRAWALASAYLAWEARPDTSTYIMHSSFNPLNNQLTCIHCKRALAERLKDVITQWSTVQRTI
ncbi:hypothetical protein BDZ94DRAFT_1250416 [Collybia nuda]|uniref:BTB domain-containing protein n=1 Tax=Collybia nuda TaxID=64659 RepID=A0A9P5YCC9_9AGAR|nr:hypothetical protein BDZ94DRAFT_1250416 [Collybia nuda]